jgi:hypothetical protein
MFNESLTSRPELENSQGQTETLARRLGMSVMPSTTDMRRQNRHVSKVPTRAAVRKWVKNSALAYL